MPIQVSLELIELGPILDTIFKARSLEKPLNFTEDENRVLALINGERTIDEILKISEFDFFTTCRILYGLIVAGALERVESIPVEKVKGNIEEYKNLGYAFFKTEMFDEAEREFQKILKIDFDNGEANFYLGLIEMKKRNWAGARDLFEKSLARNRRPNLLNNMGVVLENLNQLEDAVKFYQEALNIDPQNKKALVNLGRCFYKMNELDQAREFFEQAVAIDNLLYLPHCYLLMIYTAQGDLTKADKIVNEGKDKFMQGIEFLINSAIYYEGTGRSEEAEKIYRKILEIAPENIVARIKLANFYYREELFGAAREEYEKIPEPNRDFDIYFRLGNIYLKQGDKANALRLWEKAYELNPQDAVLIENLTILRKSSG
ncbi:MAG: tetratricopeptide repeat protein [candidate division WOR-3 bacterium]